VVDLAADFRIQDLAEWERWYKMKHAAPVVDAEHLIADAKSGVSGAGRKAELHLGFSEASDNFAAYNVPGHRHCPRSARVSRRQRANFQSLFEKRYAGEPFVEVMPAGSHPDTRSVRAANLCRIAVHRPPETSRRSDTLVVLSVIDNLVKGASGQAVQNMNLMFGFPETAGLTQVAVVP